MAARLRSRVGVLGTRLRPAVKVGVGLGVGLGAAGVAQGFYLWSHYDPLPEPTGPFRGVVSYLKQQQQQQQQRQQQQCRASSSSSAEDATTPADSRAAARSLSPASAVSGVAFASPREEACAQPPPKKKNILFVGDSLVTGVGCTNEPSLPRACAALIARALRVDVQWVAIGRTGADVAGLNHLLPAVGHEVRAAKERGGAVDVVVVLCGLNDFKHAYQGPTRSAHHFGGELTTFVDSLHQETGVHCTVVLPALPVHHAPVFNGTWPFGSMIATVAAWWDEQKESLALRASEKANALSLRRVCFVRNIVDTDGTCSAQRYWARDGVHPNDEGYAKWGEHIGSCIVRQAFTADVAKPAAAAASA